MWRLGPDGGRGVSFCRHLLAAAAITLGAIGGPASVQPLLEALADMDDEVARAAGGGLLKRGAGHCRRGRWSDMIVAGTPCPGWHATGRGHDH